MNAEGLTNMSMGKQLFLPIDHVNMQWRPQIGDTFPDFCATTTEGPLHFFDWAEGYWSFLFSHPAAFTPVCTSEMVALASTHAEFDVRKVKLLGFTASSLEDQSRWHKDMLDMFGCQVHFPTVDDQSGKFARTFGMVHEKESASWPIRKSILLDPLMRIRVIFEYPVYIGRSTDEVLRTIDALQAVDQYGVATPADWRRGDEYLCAGKHDGAHDAEKYGDRVRRLTPYLAMIKPT